MVTSIGGAGATQAAYATRAVTSTQAAASAEDTPTAATQDVADSGAQVATLSAESAAAARLGDQLSAQADAARVQRAVDASSVAPESSAETAQSSATEATSAQPPAGGAAPAGGAGAASSSGTTDSDYIAEADTNSDKTVSDGERAVYEAKLRQQAEESANTPAMSTTDPLEAKTAEVRAAYGQDGSTAPAFEITA